MMAIEEKSGLLERNSEESDFCSTETQRAPSDCCGPAKRDKDTCRSSPPRNSARSVLFVALIGAIGLDLGLLLTRTDGSAARDRKLALVDIASTNVSSLLEAYLLTAITKHNDKAGHVEAELCNTPYITTDADTLRSMEWRQTAWVQNLLNVAKARQDNPGRGWDVFNDTMMPVFHEACVTERIGNDGEGGKFVCGLEDLAQRKGCVVYSIGSNNQWDFEEAIVARTGCHVETFDCTVNEAKIPPSIQDHVTFSKLCLGTPLEAEGGSKVHREMDLTTLKELRNTRDISLLKMDVEGAEWGALRAMLRNDWDGLPEQISMEVHLWHIQPLEVALFAQQLHMAGYRAVSKEDNILGECCTEFTLVRVYCPRTNPFDDVLGWAPQLGNR